MKTLDSTISASRARTNFYNILNEVKKLKRFTITRRGSVQAVIMSPEEVESWEETMEIMSNKQLVNDIREGIEDIKAGRTISEEALLKELKISPEDLK